MWVDEAEIKVGDSLIGKIQDGIEDMDYLAIVLSPNSINSEWVNKELEMAMNDEIMGKRVKVLPLLLKQCKIPGFLKGKLYADFSSKRKFEESFERLIHAIGIDKNDIRRISGQYCIMEKDFRKKIKDYFKSRNVEVKYYDDLSGIDYVKVELGNGLFELYSHWTKPTHLQLLNFIFKNDSMNLNSIEFLIEVCVYSESEKDEFIKLLENKYGLQPNFPPNTWPNANENGKEAFKEWNNWLFERIPISLIYKQK